MKVDSLSVVVPIYNDEEVVEALLARLDPAVAPLADRYEIILVDDGSRDHSWDKMLWVKEHYPAVVLIRLSRNFGQQSAIAAGLSQTRYNYIVLMDSDLQDRPEDISLLLDALIEHKASMAIAQWISREDTSMKKFVSKCFFEVSDRITDIHIQPRLGIFRVMRRQVVEELKRFPEKTATTVSLLYYIGSNYVCVPLKRDARFAGKSGYNLRKMLSLTFARIFSFSMFPIRMPTYTGFSIAALSFVAGLVLIIRRLCGFVFPGWTSMMVLILFMFGLNFAFLGILGEYIGRVFLETKNRPKYIIQTLLPQEDGTSKQ